VQIGGIGDEPFGVSEIILWCRHCSLREFAPTCLQQAYVLGSTIAISET
jgi:hypothetical protein